jgi:hypothetical protein
MSKEHESEFTCIRYFIYSCCKEHESEQSCIRYLNICIPTVVKNEGLTNTNSHFIPTAAGNTSLKSQYIRCEI